jgi:uncharacterized Zn finger protein (UPF0148 family)
MIFEIRKSGGTTCPNCGATELVLTARTETELRHELAAALPEIVGRHRPFRRRHALHVHQIYDDAIERLKTLTHEA